MRILLVEDHADTRRVLERLLQDMGHTVTAAAGMLDALEAARTTDFDLVLSDLGLPDGSGTDLLQQLRKNGNVNLRAVSISGYGSESDIASSRAAGFAAHLTKPVRVEQIEQVLAAPQSNH
jgi:CheY-like chemotaxis protein